MANQTDMHLPRPKNEVNWNTWLSVVTLATMIAGGGTVYGTMTTRMDQTDRAQTAQGVRLDALAERTQQIDNLAYRVTVQEQSQSQLSRSVEELKALVNGQGTDLRVIREILSRMEQKIDERTTP